MGSATYHGCMAAAVSLHNPIHFGNVEATSRHISAKENPLVCAAELIIPRQDVPQHVATLNLFIYLRPKGKGRKLGRELGMKTPHDAEDADAADFKPHYPHSAPFPHSETSE